MTTSFAPPEAWRLRILQASDVEPQLQLPDFSNSSYPTRDLLRNIAQLTEVDYPPWHRAFTIFTHSILSLYLVAVYAVVLYRCRRKSFWLFRWHGNFVVCNGINCFLLAQLSFASIWIAYAAATLRGQFVPSALLGTMIVVPMGGFFAAWGSCYSIPSTSPFGRGTFSARQLNTFFIGAPLLFCTSILSLGILSCVKYDKAVAISHAFREALRRQPDSAPVTQAQLQEGTRVWAHVVAAWSYSSLLNMTCGAWCALAIICYAFVLARLFVTFRRMRREHLRRVSAAGAQVNPVWTKAASNAPATVVPELQFAVLKDNSGDAKHFFPPFKPGTYGAHDTTDVLFAKVRRNIITSACLAMSAFSFTACSSLFWAVIPPQILLISDRRPLVRIHVTGQAGISISLIVIGAAMFAEAVMQSVQPVLGSWERASTVSKAAAAEQEVRKPPRALFGINFARPSILSRVSAAPKATLSHVERTSEPIFEIKSAPSLTAGFNMPNAPQALAFPDTGGTGDEAEYISCASNGIARCSRQPSTSTMSGRYGTTSADGSYEQHRTVSVNMEHSNDDVRSADSHRRRTEEAILSYREVLERRQLPQRTEVYFARETTTYESARPTSRDAARLSQESFNSWRYPANYVPRHS